MNNNIFKTAIHLLQGIYSEAQDHFSILYNATGIITLYKKGDFEL